MISYRRDVCWDSSSGSYVSGRVINESVDDSFYAAIGVRSFEGQP